MAQNKLLQTTKLSKYFKNMSKYGTNGMSKYCKNGKICQNIVQIAKHVKYCKNGETC